MKLELAPAAVSILMERMPAVARSRDSGFIYEAGELTIPADYEDEVSAVVAVENWDVVSAAAKLETMRTAFLAAVDIEAERQRLRWITPGAGQAMTYVRKVEEAYRLEADPDPTPDRYPMLAATVGIDGGSLQEVAAVVLVKDAAWSRVGGAIEARRLFLKRQGAEASGTSELSAIQLTTGWPEDADEAQDQ